MCDSGQKPYGSGRFGVWSDDAAGLPCYRYRAPGTPTDNHWHQVGNDSITATAHTGGYVQLYDWRRGGKCINAWDPKRGHFAGGFKRVRVAAEEVRTLAGEVDLGITFGVGYVEKTSQVAGLRIVERIEAPQGDDPVLLSTTTVTNTTDAPVNLRLAECWSANIVQLTPAPIMTHGLRRFWEARRRRLNRKFVAAVRWEDGVLLVEYAIPGAKRLWSAAAIAAALPTRAETDSGCQSQAGGGDAGGGAACGCNGDSQSFESGASARTPQPQASQPPSPPPPACDCHPPYSRTVERSQASGWLGKRQLWQPHSKEASPPEDKDAIASYDRYLQCVFLAALDHQVAPSCSHSTTTASAPLPLELEPTLTLAPGESRTTQYLYGYAAAEAIPELVARYRNTTPPPRTRDVHAHFPGAPWLDREAQWHSYYLQSGAYYSDYFESHFVDQGSAYGYLQGLSGASRDYSLFVLPMIYLRPELAKDMLRFQMRSQHHRSGKLPYGYIGVGKTAGYGVHSFSSDLDLFFLWAMAEYLGATRDFAFLDEELPYYPKHIGKRGSVREHIETAFRHLRDTVGLGPHGLIRCGTGDWNDVLLAYSRFAPMTIARGESSLNAGLATVALPHLANIIGHIAPEFAQDLRAFAQRQADALEQMWTGQWLARGYLGTGKKRLGQDRLFLDAQGFPVLGGVWDQARRDTLFAAIEEHCTKPQQVGARCLWPPMRGPLLEPGSDTNGGTWAAIDSWLAQAWALHDPQKAWDFFLSTTLAARAEAYPDTWYSIWSGPDAYNAHYHPRPGETFNLNATPMSEYPVMNMNRHAGPLFALIRLAGIQPDGEGLTIDPRVPFDEWQLELPLLGIRYGKEKIAGYYRGYRQGEVKLKVRVPEAWREVRVEVDGEQVEVKIEGSFAQIVIAKSESSTMLARLRREAIWTLSVA
ncbi:MAG: hypothetical protein IT368_10945 [Candidatus Hydrogenedentes bacterium]|nr:hypothetical protein [Candidatus Hydrogenedentota bacterium]